MKHRTLLAVACVALVVAVPAPACGPDLHVVRFWPAPAAPRLTAAAPHGAFLVVPGLGVLDLVVAWRRLHGLADPPGLLPPPPLAAPADGDFATGVDAWVAARARYGPVPPVEPWRTEETMREAPATRWSTTFLNCPDDAWATAARTSPRRRSTTTG